MKRDKRTSETQIIPVVFRPRNDVAALLARLKRGGLNRSRIINSALADSLEKYCVRFGV